MGCIGRGRSGSSSTLGVRVRRGLVDGCARGGACARRGFAVARRGLAGTRVRLVGVRMGWGVDDGRRVGEGVDCVSRLPIPVEI